MSLTNHTAFFFCSILLTAGLLPSLSGQGYVLTRYTARDGLGHDNVRTIAADSSGFIWMATWDGLTRYDGTDFVNYFHDPADSTSVPYFSINQIAVDRKDNLWVATDNGILSTLDRSTDNFRRIRSIGGHQLNDLICFNPAPDGSIWFILRKGVLRFDPSSGETLFYPWSPGTPEVSAILYSRYRLMFDPGDEAWLAGSDIISFFLGADSVSGNRFAGIRSINAVERFPDRIGTFFGDTGNGGFVNDTDGNLWLASLTGLFRYEAAGNRFTEFSGDFNKIKFDTGSPVVFFDYDTGLNIAFPRLDSVITVPLETSGLPLCYLQQDPGLLWFSHTGLGGTPAGVIKTIFTFHDFRFISPFPQKSSELNVFGLIRDGEGALWIAPRDRNYLIRIGNDGLPERKLVLNNRELIEQWHARAFLPDDGALWIGYYFGKLVHYDLATGKTEEHFPGSFAHTLCYDAKGRILFSDGGVKRYDPSTRQTETLLEARDSIDWFTFHRDDTILWAGGSYSYLLRYNLESGRNEFIKIASSMTNIEDICQGDTGVLWLATLGLGVCRYDTETGEKLFFTTATGLSNNTTYAILRDQEGDIWSSTNDGLSVINPATGLVRSFGENDGLPIHEFNSDATWVSPDGKFLFGGVGGAVEFDPLKVLQAPRGTVTQKIIIKELDVSALKRLLKLPVYKADTIRLNKGDDNFHLSFVVPEYRNPEKVRYRYRLVGEGTNWYYTDHTDRNINYSNLSPGWYYLEIEATDLNGSWSNHRTVAIRIPPYFYQTTFFRMASPLTLLLLVLLVAWTVLSQIRNRENQKRDMLRHQALRGQMNPHFIFNSLNSINYFISNNDRLSANRYIADFSKLIRTVLNNMDEDFVRLTVEIDALDEYLKIEHLRFGDKFDYIIDTDPGVQTETLRVTPGLVQPFVENAIWHGVMGLNSRKGLIRVSYRMRGDMLVCTVEDDGVGRAHSEAMKDKSHPKKSKGILLATERLKILNNLLKTNLKITFSDIYTDRPETGTRVEIGLPIEQ
jgi:ligand-binding sensor domain-containing protein